MYFKLDINSFSSFRSSTKMHTHWPLINHTPVSWIISHSLWIHTSTVDHKVVQAYTSIDEFHRTPSLNDKQCIHTIPMVTPHHIIPVAGSSSTHVSQAPNIILGIKHSVEGAFLSSLVRHFPVLLSLAFFTSAHITFWYQIPYISTTRLFPVIEEQPHRHIYGI